MTYARFRSGILGGILVFTGNTAAAQPATSSLDQLRVLADSASTVTVTDRDGREFRGRITEASGSLLALRSGREIRRFPAEEVRSVRVRKDDSLADGAVIGALVGGGSVALNFLDNECHNDPACFAAVAWCAGIGVFAGMGVDALMRDEAVVYSVETPRRQALRVGPIAGRGRKGVRLTIAF